METIEYRLRPERAVFYSLFALAGAGLFYYVFGYLPLILWVGAGAIVVVAPLRLLRGFDSGPCVVLDAEGIFDRRLKVGRIAWRDIRRPYVYSLEGVEYVCLEVRDAEKYQQAQGRKWQKVGRALHRVSGLPPFAIDIACLDVDAETLVADIHRGCQAAHAR